MRKEFKCHIVSHTHWDREWYQTFQGYRKRLVFLIDHLIETLENDERYMYFHLDGQTIVLEDYLDIRPEKETALKKLIKEGRIIIGPWYVMPDEFLVSGESLIRNLNMGHEICERYGVQPMKIGYVTDIFGHNNQLPQIMSLYGINNMLLYRGIGNYPLDGFNWKGVDGSTAFVHKLDKEMSYSNFYLGFRKFIEENNYEREEIRNRFIPLLTFLKESATSGNILLMDGVDHIEIEEKLPEIIDLLKEEFKDIKFEHTKLESFFLEKKKIINELETITEELYETGKNGGVNQVLKNVLSSTVHLKQMNNQCETQLTRVAGVLDCIANLMTGNKNNMKGFIDKAWTYVIKNQPHDSICGCSISQVHRENEYRFSQALQIIDEVKKHSKLNICSEICSFNFDVDRNLTIFNFGETNNDEIVIVDIDFDEDGYENFEILDENGDKVSFQLIEIMNKHEHRQKIGRLPEFPMIYHKKIALPVNISGIGWQTFGIRKLVSKIDGFAWNPHYPPMRNISSMFITSSKIDNGLFVISIEENGCLSVFDKETNKQYDNLLYFESSGDCGDGWNYRKTLREEKTTSLQGKAFVRIQSDGELCVELDIYNEMLLPRSLANKSNEKLNIKTNVMIRKNSRRIDFCTSIDNNILNHRLRVLFDTNLNTDSFYANTPFYMTKRNIHIDPKKDYVEPETFVTPNQGIVCIKDKDATIGLYNKGMYELEIRENLSRTLILTLFRSITEEAGGGFAEIASQQRAMKFEYAIDIQKPDLSTSEIINRGMDFKIGLESSVYKPYERKTEYLPKNSFIKISEPGIVISALENDSDNNILLRLFNSTDKSISTKINIAASVKQIFAVDVMGIKVLNQIPFNGEYFDIGFKAGEIITLQIINSKYSCS